LLYKEKIYLISFYKNNEISWKKASYLGWSPDEEKNGGMTLTFQFEDGTTRTASMDNNEDLYWDDSDEYFDFKIFDKNDIKLSEKQRKAFDDISSLEDGWTSYSSSRAPSFVVIEKAKKLCIFLGEDCEIQPSSDGSIDLFFDGVIYSISEES